MEIKNIFKDPRVNWKYIAVLIIFAVIAGAGILAYINKTNQEIDSFNSISEIQISEKIVKDETADWKTYKNEKYGFEIKYPKNWVIEIKDPYNLCRSGQEFSCLASIQFSPSLSLNANYSDIGLIILTNPKKYSTQKWIEEYTPEILKDAFLSVFENIEIGKINGVKIVFTNTITDPFITNTADFSKEIGYSVAKGKNLFGLSTRITGKWDKKTEYIIEQMLSTFRFLE